MELSTLSATAEFYKSGRSLFTGTWLYLLYPKHKHKGHPLNANAREVFHFLQAKKISLETQLKIANLKYENEELTKKNKKLTNTLKLKSQQLLNYSLRLRGTHTFW